MEREYTPGDRGTPRAKPKLQVLNEARELIAQGFAQGSYALGPTGDDVDALSGDATCFCTLGALAHAEGFNTYGVNEASPYAMYRRSAAVREVTQTLIDLGGDVSHVEREETRVVVVPAYNDQATQEQVLQVFDITINRVKEEL